jgi:hypothetical protein
LISPETPVSLGLRRNPTLVDFTAAAGLVDLDDVEAPKSCVKKTSISRLQNSMKFIVCSCLFMIYGFFSIAYSWGYEN